MTNSPRRVRALLVGVRSYGFATDWALHRVKTTIETMFPEHPKVIEVVTGRAACKREPLRRRILQWVEDTRPGDICSFYYFGHGGRARFLDLASSAAAEQVVSYLSCEPSSPTEFTALLGRELSAWLSEVDRRCGNVTAIIDACYSATVVRDGHEPVATREVKTLRTFERSPEWVRDELDRAASKLLAPESHPRVVRLSGASPRRAAHLDDARGNAGVGMFTVALLDVLEAVGHDWHDLSWEMLAHAVRERVITSHGMEGQWISLAGPRDRLLFSTRQLERSPRVVGYRAALDGHWLRAGELTGVEAGDRWALVDPLAGSGAGHEPLLSGTIELGGVELNRARLTLDPDQLAPRGPLSPVAAMLQRVERPLPVFVDELIRPSLRLAETVWLQAGGPDARHRVRLVDGRLELIDADDVWAPARFDADDTGRTQLVELLEDRARAARLVASLADLEQRRRPRSPITWRVGVDANAVEAGAEVRPGANLWVRLQNTASGGPHWFSSVVLIDVVGRPWSLNASQLDGIELEPNDLEYIGRRIGAVHDGLSLAWPRHAVADKPRPVRLVLIASGRPIQLGHLAQALPASELDAVRTPSLEHHIDRGEPGSAAKPPAPSRDWGWSSVELSLALPDT